MRILMVADVSPLQPSGGSVRVVKEQALRLSARGHSLTVFCRRPADQTTASHSLNGVDVLHYPVNRTNSVLYASTSILGARKAFRDRLSNETWDAVVFHQPLSAIGVYPLLDPNLPCLYCFYSPAGDEYRLRATDPETGRTPVATGILSAALRRLEKRALARSDRIIVLSQFSRHLLSETHHPLSPPVVTIPGGVDVEHFCPPSDRAATRERLKLPRDGHLFLTVRDLEQRMGIDTLLEALTRLPKDEAFYCFIGGTGPLRGYLERLSERLGLANRVRFLGYIPEGQLPLYYQAADLFVLPTRAHEGFGLVTVEALACGTPVVGTPAGATSEILSPLDPRLLAPSCEASELASALEVALPLAADQGFRRRCRRHVEANYSWDRHVETLEKELSSVTR